MQHIVYMSLYVGFLGAAALLPLTPARAARGDDGAAMFTQADSNHDGVVSRQEFDAARQGRFAQRDRNGDGYIDTADLPRFARSRGTLAQKFEAMVKAADRDGDGRVSRQEFAAAGRALFALADANHDGVVDHGEAQQARQRMQAMAGGRQGAP